MCVVERVATDFSRVIFSSMALQPAKSWLAGIGVLVFLSQNEISIYENPVEQKRFDWILVSLIKGKWLIKTLFLEMYSQRRFDSARIMHESRCPRITWFNYRLDRFSSREKNEISPSESENQYAGSLLHASSQDSWADIRRVVSCNVRYINRIHMEKEK